MPIFVGDAEVKDPKQYWDRESGQ